MRTLRALKWSLILMHLCSMKHSNRVQFVFRSVSVPHTHTHEIPETQMNNIQPETSITPLNQIHHCFVWKKTHPGLCCICTVFSPSLIIWPQSRRICSEFRGFLMSAAVTCQRRTDITIIATIITAAAVSPSVEQP